MALRWKIYAFLYSIAILLNVYFSLCQACPAYNYYQILIALDKSHWANFTFFYLANLMEVISLVPLFLFVFKVKFLSQDFWKIIFLGRIAGILGGRNFEYNVIKSLLFANFSVIVFAVIVTALIALPSFIAQFLYSFREK